MDLKCPECKEKVKFTAKKCPHCLTQLSENNEFKMQQKITSYLIAIVIGIIYGFWIFK